MVRGGRSKVLGLGFGFRVYRDMGISQIMGTVFGGPEKTSYSIWVAEMGSPYLAKLPYMVVSMDC